MSSEKYSKGNEVLGDLLGRTVDELYPIGPLEVAEQDAVPIDIDRDWEMRMYFQNDRLPTVDERAYKWKSDKTPDQPTTKEEPTNVVDQGTKEEPSNVHNQPAAANQPANQRPNNNPPCATCKGRPVWQKGASTCRKCMRRNVGVAGWAQVDAWAAQGIMTCTNCMKRPQRAEGKWCQTCYERKSGK